MSLLQGTAAAAADTGAGIHATAGQGLSHWEHQTRLSDDPSDAVDSYFQCITTCSLEDGECITRCVEELRALA